MKKIALLQNLFYTFSIFLNNVIKKAQQKFIVLLTMVPSLIGNYWLFIRYHSHSVGTYSWPVLKSLLIDLELRPDVLCSGRKLINIRLKDKNNCIVFRDSYLYFNLPLYKCPAAFGLGCGQKGVFPLNLLSQRFKDDQHLPWPAREELGNISEEDYEYQVGTRFQRLVQRPRKYYYII